jgi:hypothetical protein
MVIKGKKFIKVYSQKLICLFVWVITVVMVSFNAVTPLIIDLERSSFFVLKKNVIKADLEKFQYAAASRKVVLLGAYF